MSVHFVKKPYQRKDGVWIAESWEDIGQSRFSEEAFFATEEEALEHIAKRKEELNAYDFETFKGKVPVTDGSERQVDKKGRFVKVPNNKSQEEFEAVNPK